MPYMSSHLIFTLELREVYCHYPHFVDEDDEA